MTSPETAENYLCNMADEGIKEFILFDESAHYPQFEEEEKFYQWMKKTFRNQQNTNSGLLENRHAKQQKISICNP